MTFSDITSRITNLIIKELNYSDEKKEIIAYAIETVLLSVFGTILLVIFGYLVDALEPAMIAALFGVLLRRVSGGAHFNTPLKCLLIGAVIYTAIGVLAKIIVANDLLNATFQMLILLVSLILVALLAPVDSDAKPIHSSKLKISLKVSSMIFIGLSFLMITFTHYKLLNVSAILGLFYQSITLLPIFNRKGGVIL
ncbi:MAG: accessory gene regulator B family protein [Desulfitobacteriaceae bacterium]|nr:accessory gene regulator B family protein [Desulfitobacteriaceae bacterium]MDI6913048.1 accessory gene regulator B family protein [Desulfitobacteriaceae bacterium]